MKPKETKAIALIGLAMVAVTSMTPVVARAEGFDPPQNAEERRALFRRGAQLWPVYCNTCHNARPSSEFSPAEWNIIMMHMRTQANLPAEDARAVLEYLKESK